MPTALRVAAALVAGAAVYAAFPPVGWWPTMILGLALLVPALAPIGTSRPRARTGAFLGLAFGFAFFMLLWPWVGLYVGAYAAWGLAVFEALYLAAFGAGAVPLIRWSRGGPRWRWLAAPLGLAAWWSLWETIRGSWPWGGFPWGSLAFGHADGPLLPLAALGGAEFLGFVLAAAGFALGFAVLALLDRRPVGAALPLAIPVVCAVTVPLASSPLAGTDGTAGPEDGARTANLAVIQGNVPRLGLDFNAQRAAVLQNHLDETRRLAERVDTGEVPQPDVVLWPENASDIPLGDDEAAEAISAASQDVGAPISFGTIERLGDGPEAYNTQIVWDAYRGEVDRHDKEYIQPFGEWLPWRGFFESLFPIAESAGNFVPGSGDGVVTASGLSLGVAICFEVAFGSAVRDAVGGGAEVLTVPTNNATFGHSAMTYQQLAMSRVRAVEHDIPVLISATSGVSAVIDRDGTVEQETEIFEAATLTTEVSLDGAGTLATRVGGAVQLALAIAGILAVALAVAARGEHKGSGRSDD